MLLYKRIEHGGFQWPRTAQEMRNLSWQEQSKLEKPENTENRIHDLDQEEQICPQCGGSLSRIGKELVRETFEYIPAQMKLVRHWQTAYQCSCCRKNGRSLCVLRWKSRC